MSPVATCLWNRAHFVGLFAIQVEPEEAAVLWLFTSQNPLFGPLPGKIPDTPPLTRPAKLLIKMIFFVPGKRIKNSLTIAVHILLG